MKLWDRMHVGIVHPMAYPETLGGGGPVKETVMEIVKDPFFGAIEVSWVKDFETRNKLAQILKSSHMDVIFCAGPPILMNEIDLNSENRTIRTKAVEEVKKLIDQACFLNSKIFLLCSGPNPEAEKRREAKGYLIDSLRELCEYAKEKSTVVSLEYFDKEIDKKLLIGSSHDAAEIAEAVRIYHSNFGLTVDLSHLPLLGETSEEALTVIKDYLVHVHIGNCSLAENSPAYGDKHPRFGIEHGEVDVDELRIFLDSVRKVGYFDKKAPTSLPVVSFEVKPLAGESSEVIIANAKRTLIDALRG